METQSTEKNEKNNAPMPRSVTGAISLFASGACFTASGAAIGNVVLMALGVTMIAIGALLYIKRPR
jgi:hypothetical protein